MPSAVLAQLEQHARAIGADVRLVQGAGGNLSGKDDGVVWVKASGTRLGDAGEGPIFVGVDAAAARDEVLRSEDLRHVVVELPDGAPARPSIETALHVLLPQTYVFHVHSVGALSLAVQRDPADALGRLRELVPAQWVPYAKPGIALARAVLGALGTQEPDAEAVLVLGNHGLVTAAADADRARALVDQVETALRTGGDPAAAGEREQLLAAGALTAAQTAVLTGGVLTPDEAVFLGPRPVGTGEDAAPVLVTGDGAVLVPAELSRDARDLVLSLVDTVQHLDPDAPMRYLTEDEVRELVDWEAEKWRLGMQSR